MKRAMDEMDRRRVKQLAYNTEHQISPKTVIKAIHDLEEFQIHAREIHMNHIFMDSEMPQLQPDKLAQYVQDLEAQMLEAADNLQFELAASIRDRLAQIRQMAPKSHLKENKKSKLPSPK